MNLFAIMGVSLVSTIVIEILVSLIIGIRDRKDILNVFLVNILTNPLVVSISYLVNLRYGLIRKNIVLVFLELSAVLIEGFIYKRVLEYKKINGYLTSLLLNIVSYSLGIIINMIVW